LACAVEKLGRREEALGWYARAYEGAREVLGEEHTDTKDYLRDWERLKRRDEGENIQYLPY
jgi:hypothetical protein